MMTDTGNIGGMQKSGAFQSDLDKSRLHTRQHPANTAFVDITDQPPLFDAFDQNLLHHAIFDDGNPGFGRSHIDQNLFTHFCRGIISPTLLGKVAASKNSNPMTTE